MSKKVFVTGASGFIGKKLLPALLSAGYDVVAMSRKVRDTSSGVRWVVGETMVADDWQKQIDGAYGVINLAGEPIVGKRWTPEQKKILRDSRVLTTNNVVEAIEKSEKKPAVLVSASATGFYPKNLDTPFDESARPGDDFLGMICQEWEDAAKVIESHGVRTVLLRIGVVFGPDGGALERMLPIFKLGLGGPIGSGNQWMPWIHVDDVIALILFALANPGVAGPVNAVAPEPVQMKELATGLGRVLNRPAFFPAPAFALNLMLGESAQVVLDGCRAVPKAALDAGYKFKFPTLDEALRDIVG